MRMYPGRILIAVSLLLGAGARQLASQAGDTAWRYTAPGKISWFCVCHGDRMLMGTKAQLASIDLASGAESWLLTDLPTSEKGLWLLRGDSVPALSYQKNRMVALDLRTGQRLWAADSIQAGREIKGFMLVEGGDLLVLFVSGQGPLPTALGLRLSTGAPLWQRPTCLPCRPASRTCSADPSSRITNRPYWLRILSWFST